MRAGRAAGLLLGVFADSAFGHRKQGKPVATVERFARAVEAALPGNGQAAGVLYAGGVTGSTIVVGLCLERLGRRHGVLHTVTTAAATWLVLGGAGLALEGTALARHLETGDLQAARDVLSTLDPRCTGSLDAVELSRVSVETVAEHTSETVVAPLLWGVLAGVPGLAGARAVALLRRRLELQRRRGERFRQFPALLADVVQLLPTRAAAALAVSGAPVVGGSATSAWRAWRRDTLAHPSPNAGRVEAAFAGALEIRLGGRTIYPHGPVELPVLGNGRNPDAGHVTRAVELSRVVGWLAGGAAAVLAATAGIRRPGDGR